MSEIIIHEDLEKICAAIWNSLLKVDSSGGLQCSVPEFLTFNPPGTSGIDKDGELSARSTTGYCTLTTDGCMNLIPSSSCHHTKYHSSKWHLPGVVKNKQTFWFNEVWNNKRLNFSFSCFSLEFKNVTYLWKSTDCPYSKHSSSLFSKNKHGQLYLGRICFPLSYFQARKKFVNVF